MGKGKHEEWDGFTEIRNADGKIVGAQCNKCKRPRTKRDAASLASHKKICKGLSSQPLQERNDNAENILDAADAAVENVNLVEEETDFLDTSLNSSQSSQGKSPQVSKDLSLKSERSKREIDRKRTILIMKFFMSCGIELEHIKSMHCRNVFEAFDPDYKLPSVEEFQTSILKATRDEVCKEIATYNYQNIMSVQTYETNEYVHAVSLAIHSKMQYVYVDYTLLKKDECILKDELERFCDKSVKKLSDGQNLFKVTIKYVIYDGSTLLSENGAIDNITYTRIRCMSALIQTLKNNHGSFTINSPNDADLVSNYYKTVDNLDKKFKLKECSLGEAVEDLLKCFDDGTLILSENIKRIIFQFLSGTALTANFLNPKYKGHFFIEKEPIASIMFTFIDDYLPVNAFDGLAAYKQCTKAFERLFRTNKQFDFQRFWSIARLENEAISDFAVELFNLPAIPRKINMNKFLKLQSDINCQETKDNAKLLISLSLNENA